MSSGGSGTEQGGANSRRGIPYAVIKRLPMYYRTLVQLQAREVERVSSRELAKKVGIKASQLRQDLNLFGSFGQQGYGYRVDELLRAIEKILGLNRRYKMVIIGAGNLGSAIARYENFHRRGFQTVGIFDQNPEIIGKMIAGLPVMDVAGLPAHLQAHDVDIGIITTPAEAARDVCRTLIEGGVKGIWNFAPVRLEVPPDVSLEHIHLGESLYALTFKMNQETRPR